MEYVELLRVRRALVSFVVALAFAYVLITLVLHGHGSLALKANFGKDGIGVDDLLLAGGFGALFLATFFAGNLPGESATLPFLWTKPVSRTALACRFVAIDALGMAAGVVATVLATVAVIAGMGELRAIHPGAHLFANAALALGAPLAWYGLTLLVAARSGQDGAARAGALSWPVFIVIAMLATVALPPAARAAAVALAHLDPLLYLVGTDRPGDGLLRAGVPVRAAACWTIAVLSTVPAIRLWSTREA